MNDTPADSPPRTHQAGPAPHLAHADHGEHRHGPDCGHRTLSHGDHVDYLDEGHRHAEHEGHWDEHGPPIADATMDWGSTVEAAEAVDETMATSPPSPTGSEAGVDPLKSMVEEESEAAGSAERASGQSQTEDGRR